MEMTPNNTGSEHLASTALTPTTLARFIAEQIDTLPGVADHADQLAVLLTSSRALGTHREDSDVDIDVACSQAVYDSVVRASFEAGLIASDKGFFRVLREEGWGSYFGEEKGPAP